MQRISTSSTIIFVLLLSSLTACDVPARHAEADANQIIAPLADKNAVTEIALERTPCYGTCPVYTLAIKDDGSFHYHGEAHVDRLGDHTGKITREQFAALAKFAVESKFMNFDAKYSAPITDQATVITTVVMEGQKKSVKDYGHAGPEALQKFETMIAESIKDAKWD